MSREQYDAKMKVVYDKWSKCGVDNENLLMLRGEVKDEYIASLEASIAELESQSHSEALIRSELEEQIDFFTRSLHCTQANTYEALTGRIKELEARLTEKETECQD